MEKKAFVLLIFLSFNYVYPCTNFIVTKGASVDGSTILTYTADSFTLYGELYFYPPAIYPNGTMLDVYEWDTGKFLGRIKQAPQTYKVVGNMNEHQLVIAETTFGGREELINPDGILDYGSLIYITLQRAKTAREAIKIMIDLVEEYGYRSSGESISIVDPNEAWILEIIGKGKGSKGAIYVAIKIPDGSVSAHANQARIQKFPLNDPKNCIYAPDVISFARQKGYFNGKDEDFDFAQAYNPLDFGGIRFCDARVWSLFRRVNSQMDKYISYIKGESLERMPLWIKPDRKLSVQDIMQLMRDHYQGTELDMTIGVAAGPYNMPYRWRPLVWEYKGEKYFNERPISTPQTAFSFVAQVRSYLPNEVGGVLWFGVDDTYFTVYVPLYCSISEPPYNFKQGIGSLSHFDWNSMFWTFNVVSNYCYPKFSQTIGDVQKVQRELEGEFLANQETIEKKAIELLKRSKADAIEYLTQYSHRTTEKTHKRWQLLWQELNVKYLDGIQKDEFYRPKNIGYPEEFKAKILAENPEKYKYKTLDIEKNEQISDLIRKAEEALKEKKFKEAKSYFEKVLKLDANNENAKVNIQKIDKTLEEINKIYNNIFTK
jgi:dipeptidase